MRIFLTAAVLVSLAATPVFAQDSAKVILDRHEKTIKAGDLNGVMADYADNAVLVAPAGIVKGEKDVVGTNVFDGKANIRKFFTVLTSKESNPAVKSMKVEYEFKGSDVVVMKWAQFPGTPKEVAGTDIWVIRGGKIISQVVLVNPPKK
jgi:ketosteroid isomerase-like protein